MRFSLTIRTLVNRNFPIFFDRSTAFKTKPSSLTPYHLQRPAVRSGLFVEEKRNPVFDIKPDFGIHSNILEWNEANKNFVKELIAALQVIKWVCSFS